MTTNVAPVQSWLIVKEHIRKREREWVCSVFEEITAKNPDRLSIFDLDFDVSPGRFRDGARGKWFNAKGIERLFEQNPLNWTECFE